MNHAAQALQKRVEMLEVTLVRTAVLMEALESSACAFAFDLGTTFDGNVWEGDTCARWDEAMAAMKPKKVAE